MTHSDVVLTVAQSVAKQFTGVLPIVCFDPPLPVQPFTMTMAWHPRQDADPLQAWVRAQVRACRP